MDYEKLYKSYYMQVYSYAVSLARNRTLAEDITEETFYRAATASSTFDSRSSELTWLCAIAKNLYLDECRKKRPIADLDDAAEPRSDDDPARAVADSDMAFRIHLILHQLEEPYKEVFQLRVFGDLSFAQIASIFGKTEVWARVTYHRARLKIQERMDRNHG